MSKKFRSFVFPETIKKQIDAMPSDMKLKFYIAVTDYGMYGAEPENLNEIESLIWISMHDLIDNCKGSNGGAPEGNQNAQKQLKQPKTTETTQNNQNNVDFTKTTETTLINDNDNLNDNDNDNLNDNHKDIQQQVAGTSSKKKFIKPTLEEIKDYCKERQNSVDPQSFIDFYDSKGWKIGNQTMKDWKAAIRTWEHRTQIPVYYSQTNNTLPEDRLTL